VKIGSKERTREERLGKKIAVGQKRNTCKILSMEGAVAKEISIYETNPNTLQ
jgi:hypothetical protein